MPRFVLILSKLDDQQNPQYLVSGENKTSSKLRKVVLFYH